MTELSVLGGLEWIFDCFKPIDTVKQAIQVQRQEGRTKFLGRFWAMPIVIALLLNVPIFRSVSLSVEHDTIMMGFLLLSDSVKQALGGFVLLAILRIFRIRLDTTVAMGCYTIFVIYSPIFALMELHETYIRDLVLVNIKAQHLELLDSLTFWLGGKAKPSPDDVTNWPSVIAITNWIYQIRNVFNLVEIVFVAECLSQIIAANRFRTYFAVTVGSFLFFVPAFLAAAVQAAVVFTAAK
jgi:hypothetical protein